MTKKENTEFAERLKKAMQAQGIKDSPTVLQRKFNLQYKGIGITPHKAKNWMLGVNLPTPDKMICLAKVLDTSVKFLQFGITIEKTMAVVMQDGSETELSTSQQHFVQKYLSLTMPQQTLMNSLVSEISRKP